MFSNVIFFLMEFTLKWAYIETKIEFIRIDSKELCINNFKWYRINMQRIMQYNEWKMSNLGRRLHETGNNVINIHLLTALRGFKSF